MLAPTRLSARTTSAQVPQTLLTASTTLPLATTFGSSDARKAPIPQAIVVASTLPP